MFPAPKAGENVFTSGFRRYEGTRTGGVTRG